jgi:hypothetical protein
MSAQTESTVSLAKLLKNLPPYLDTEIYSFILPEHAQVSNVIFKMYHYSCTWYYCNNKFKKYPYEVAHDAMDKLMKIGNEDMEMTFLSRQQNGKGTYSYYITKQFHNYECSICGDDRCLVSDCCGSIRDQFNYSYEWIADDLQAALLCFYNCRESNYSMYSYSEDD